MQQRSSLSSISSRNANCAKAAAACVSSQVGSPLSSCQQKQQIAESLAAGQLVQMPKRRLAAELLPAWVLQKLDSVPYVAISLCFMRHLLVSRQAAGSVLCFLASGLLDLCQANWQQNTRITWTGPLMRCSRTSSRDARPCAVPPRAWSPGLEGSGLSVLDSE